MEELLPQEGLKEEMDGVGGGRSGKEEKFKLLEGVFRELGLPVCLKRVFANRWGAFLDDKSLCFFDEEPPSKRWTFEKWLARNAGAIFASLVKVLFERVVGRLRKRLGLSRGELREFYHGCHYYLIGCFGRELAPRIDFLKKTRKVPKWLREVSCIPFWVDHTFYAQGDVFVSEPYEMNLKDLKALCEFCDSHGLDAEIRGFSRWFPGHTFRVVIRPRKGDERW